MIKLTKSLFLLLSCTALFSLASAQAGSWSDAVDRLVDDVVVPAHVDFNDRAKTHLQIVKSFCDGQGDMEQALSSYRDLVHAFSRIELYRFGPARENYRHERLFYWPDRKGRGLKQVQKILNTQDETAIQAETIRKKSVAVQGLLAQDFVLTREEITPYACDYLVAISEATSLTASELLDGWTSDDGFVFLLKNAGQEGSPYKSHKEVMQDFLRAAKEQVQLVKDMKIGSVLGNSFEKVKPKRAPFWRTDLTILSMKGNLEGVQALMATDILVPLLNPEDQTIPQEVSFEVEQVLKTLSTVGAEEKPFVQAVAGRDVYDQLQFTRISLNALEVLIGERYSESMGLTLGFNSLDGD